jgi:hypothetical protein
MSTLVGRFIFHDAGDYHRTGEIIDQITPDIAMVSWHPVSDGPGGAPGDLLTLVAILT